MKQTYLNQKGITLIELLLTLVIFSIISTVVYGVFFQFNSHYAKINSEVELRDEADIIMATFTNYIYPSTEVTTILEDQLLKVKVSETTYVNLGFKDGDAVVSNEYTDGDTVIYSAINSDKYYLYTDSTINVAGRLVETRLHIHSRDVAQAKPFIVESKISYVK